MRGKTLQGEMVIKTIRPTWSREMEMKVWMKGTEYSMIYILTPQKDKGTTFLKRKKEVWNWIPTLERSIKLPPSMMSQSWMGTDFTNDDLVKEASIADDFDSKILSDANIGDRTCWKIELIAKPDAAVVWNRIVIYIDKKDYLQMKSEFYDDENELVNVMTSSEIKEMGGRIIPTKLEMIPADKPGNKTIIEYRKLIFDKPIDDNFFTTQQMKTLK